MNLENLDTPNVVINEAIVEQNIQRVQSFFDGLGIAFRPHIKTHKSIEIAKKQLKAGAKGINCQKLSEAEVFAKAGFKDILLSYNVVGEKRRLSKNCPITVLLIVLNQSIFPAVTIFIWKALQN